MYIPPANAVNDPGALRDFIRRYSFATLITATDGAPVATHLPLLLEDRGDQGALVGHLARGNPQWRAFDGRAEALVIFSGPHAYISPAWYETHPSVPTWNYMVAHVYGAPRVVEDEAAVRRHLLALITHFESGRAHPFEPSYEEDYLRGMMRGVVAFELPIARIEGKFKLSQNRDATDRAHVTEALAASDAQDERGVAAAMRALGLAPSS
ncbi:MAG TPA: FMN-binding negative transcriptional regulator [Ktedonobacterales bacterium]